jgi:hypothetical protein
MQQNLKRKWAVEFSSSPHVDNVDIKLRNMNFTKNILFPFITIINSVSDELDINDIVFCGIFLLN